jgi:hypothetical protein
MCQCPGHEDRAPSLSLRTGKTGKILMYCFAGCGNAHILRVLGIRFSDLEDADEVHPLKQSQSRAFATAEEAKDAVSHRLGPPDYEWRYNSADGRPVGFVLRWDTGRGKEIRPISLVRGRGWVIGGMPEPRPIYNLDLLHNRPGETVYVTEGEKAADAVLAVDLLATTSPHGAKSAGKADWSPLAGRRVVILPDNDAPGEEYAEAVAWEATVAGAASVDTIRLREIWPGIPAHGDYADLLVHLGGDMEVARTCLLNSHPLIA